MPTCSRCKESKPEEAFSRRGEGRIRGVCKDCVNTYSRGYYHEHRERYVATRRRNKRSQRTRLREIASTMKDVPCADCGESYPYYVMDFDHRSGTNKRENIATMVNQPVPKSVLLEEISKCDVVCSNCHRERTHNRDVV